MLDNIVKTIDKENFNKQMTYKELCGIFNEKEKPNYNYRLNQITTWKSYYDIEEIGYGKTHKYIIKGENKNMESSITLKETKKAYQTYIRVLLLNFLANSPKVKDNEIVINRVDLMNELALVNNNYSTIKRVMNLPKDKLTKEQREIYNNFISDFSKKGTFTNNLYLTAFERYRDKVSNTDKIKEIEIKNETKDFIRKSSKTLWDMVETALNRLEKGYQCLDWSYTYKLYHVTEVQAYDEANNPILDEYGREVLVTRTITRDLNAKQRQIVYQINKDCLARFGFFNFYDYYKAKNQIGNPKLQEQVKSFDNEVLKRVKEEIWEDCDYFARCIYINMGAGDTMQFYANRENKMLLNDNVCQKILESKEFKGIFFLDKFVDTLIKLPDNPTTIDKVNVSHDLDYLIDD